MSSIFLFFLLFFFQGHFFSSQLPFRRKDGKSIAKKFWNEKRDVTATSDSCRHPSSMELWLTEIIRMLLSSLEGILVD